MGPTWASDGVFSDILSSTNITHKEYDNIFSDNVGQCLILSRIYSVKIHLLSDSFNGFVIQKAKHVYVFISISLNVILRNSHSVI